MAARGRKEFCCPFVYAVVDGDASCGGDGDGFIGGITNNGAQNWIVPNFGHAKTQRQAEGANGGIEGDFFPLRRSHITTLIDLNSRAAPSGGNGMPRRIIMDHDARPGAIMADDAVGIAIQSEKAHGHGAWLTKTILGGDAELR